jgi:hypothetical protein
LRSGEATARKRTRGDHGFRERQTTFNSGLIPRIPVDREHRRIVESPRKRAVEIDAAGSSGKREHSLREG